MGAVHRARHTPAARATANNRRAAMARATTARPKRLAREIVRPAPAATGGARRARTKPAARIAHPIPHAAATGAAMPGSPLRVARAIVASAAMGCAVRARTEQAVRKTADKDRAAMPSVSRTWARMPRAARRTASRIVAMGFVSRKSANRQPAARPIANTAIAATGRAGQTRTPIAVSSIAVTAVMACADQKKILRFARSIAAPA
jgi:hypothetical protein